MQQTIMKLVLFYPVFLFCLAVHESAHAWTANKFGDPTAKQLGRVSLNPMAHIDIVGTVILPIIGIVTGMAIIGWGKPVPVNLYNLRGETRKSNLWVAFAGPASNLLMAGILSAAIWLMLYNTPVAAKAYSNAIGLVFYAMQPANLDALTIAMAMLVLATWLNIILACFNLIPLHPLDGGSVLRGLLPASSLPAFDNFSRYSFLILLVLFATGLLRYVLYPALMLASFLLP